MPLWLRRATPPKLPSESKISDFPCISPKKVVPLHPQSTTGSPTDANGVHPVGKAQLTAKVHMTDVSGIVLSRKASAVPLHAKLRARRKLNRIIRQRRTWII